jgi:hypothetical protein
VVNSQLGGDDIPDLNTTTCIFQSTCKYVFGIAIAFMVGVLKKEILKKALLVAISWIKICVLLKLRLKLQLNKKQLKDV